MLTEKQIQEYAQKMSDVALTQHALSMGAEWANGVNAKEIDSLRAENARLLEALKEIVSPITYMQERRQEGERLNGREAVNLSHSVEYLRGIARAAIAEAEK